MRGFSFYWNYIIDNFIQKYIAKFKFGIASILRLTVIKPNIQKIFAIISFGFYDFF